MRSNAMNAAKTLRCLSSQKQANLFTAAHASRNVFQGSGNVQILTSVLTPKTHGQGEGAILKEEKRQNQLAFSKNIRKQT